MAKTKHQVQALLRELSLKVKAGIMSKDEAAKLAVLAVEEVAPTPSQAADAPPPPPPAEEKAPAPEAGAPTLDPKNQLIGLLTSLEKAFGAAWKEFQTKVTEVIKGTEGAAVPLGDFEIDVADHNVKLQVDQIDQANVKCRYTTRRDWKVGGLKMEYSRMKSESSVEPSCHLPLRRDIVAITEEILENTDSALAWRKYRLPVTAILNARHGAARENDKRLVSILASIPTGDDTNSAQAWQVWANAAQVMLLGSDYSVDKKFEEIVAEVKG